MISITAIMQALPSLLALPVRATVDHPSLLRLCRMWGWAGRDNSLKQTGFILEIMRRSTTFHANRSGDFDLLEEKEFIRERPQSEVLAELQLEIERLTTEC